MSYYSKNNKTDLADIGTKAFEDIDELFPRGCYSKYPPLQVVNYHQRQRQQDNYVVQRPVAVVQRQVYDPPKAVVQRQVYEAPVEEVQRQVYDSPVAVVQRQVYNPPVAAMTNEKVIDSNEAAMKYGGTLYVEYSKRKPVARKGFFF
ncbi:hypothetical protein Tco_0030708 [Tanacetum coccineum]